MRAAFGECPVNSPTRITPDNNGKIRPQSDRENAFVRASGGGDGNGGEPSLGSTQAGTLLATCVNSALGSSEYEEIGVGEREVCAQGGEVDTTASS